jgi:hypothetical protein
MTTVKDYLDSIRQSLTWIELGTDSHLEPDGSLLVYLRQLDNIADEAATVFGTAAEAP